VGKSSLNIASAACVSGHRTGCQPFRTPCRFGHGLCDRYRRLDVFGVRLFRQSAPPCTDVQPVSGLRTLTRAWLAPFHSARVRPVSDDIRAFFGWAGDRRRRTLPNTSRTDTRYGSCTRPFAHHMTCWRDPIERVSGRGCHPPPTPDRPGLDC
jgi:hypothetical protein